MSKPKIVDLVQNGDGSYEPKGNKKATVPAKNKKTSNGFKDNRQYKVSTEADEFLAGIDVGLDFIDKVVPRVERFFKLRG